MENRTDLHLRTGAAWDETAVNYERAVGEEIAFLRAGGNSLKEPERRVLSDLSSWCHRAIHLQCSGGLDALSLLRQGAKEVVGVDISPRMIATARQKSEALAAPATWYVADILETPHELDRTADLVYTGCGALPWMMDMDAWAGVVARLLKPGGRLFIFEGHPLDWVWKTDASEYRLDDRHGDYFSQTINDSRWPAPFLISRERPAEAERPRAFEHQWTLGDILNALVRASLTLEHFQEYPDLYWDHFPNIPPDLARSLPHTFSLLMRKT